MPESLHVAEADTAIAIGPSKAAESYLRVDAILDAARQAKADAVHPGYGFLAENAGFARAVEAAGLIFVGPRPDQIDAMGDKERARNAAREAGVPVLPASERLEPDTQADLAAAAEMVGFPLLVKAAAGGGGIGMRLVEDLSTLTATVAATQAMAARVFGDGAVYLEHYVQHARHVEVQVFGHGRRAGDAPVRTGMLDPATVSRRSSRKAPRPALIRPPVPRCARRLSLWRVRCRIARPVRLNSWSTRIPDASSFLEMNTRIQVEHPVTEMRTGADLVDLQLRLASGEDVWPCPAGHQGQRPRD